MWSSLQALSFLTCLSGSALAQSRYASDSSIASTLVKRGVDAGIVRDLSNSRNSTSNCAAACSLLNYAFGNGSVEFPGQAAYKNFTASYWSEIQAEVSPACVFKPATEDQVSTVILTSQLSRCPFAVKSGGHAAFAGASSSQGGITIALENMKGKTVAADNQTVAVQPGNTWIEVYEFLAQYELLVIGGRVEDIGVGGLTLGGGLSYFANLYGWASDNVQSYRVALADGSVVTASPEENADLYAALRGGGNNFGIVVEFNYLAYPFPGNVLWGGTRIFSPEYFDDITQAFVGFTENSQQDRKAQNWIEFIRIGGQDIVGAELVYSDPAGGRHKPIFADYYKNYTVESDSTGVRSLVNYSQELQQGGGYYLRQSYTAVTVKADFEVLQYARDLFFQQLSTVANVTGLFPVLAYQVITEPQLEAKQKFNGTYQGLELSDGPLVIVQISTWWNYSSDDAQVLAFEQNSLNSIVAYAKSKCKDTDFIYMNYAGPFEDVIASYGAANKQSLIGISQKYDPSQVFQRLQPGYFKLQGTPDSPATPASPSGRRRRSL